MYPRVARCLVGRSRAAASVIRECGRARATHGPSTGRAWALSGRWFLISSGAATQQRRAAGAPGRGARWAARDPTAPRASRAGQPARGRLRVRARAAGAGLSRSFRRQQAGLKYRGARGAVSRGLLSSDQGAARRRAAATLHAAGAPASDRRARGQRPPCAAGAGARSLEEGPRRASREGRGGPRLDAPGQGPGMEKDQPNRLISGARGPGAGSAPVGRARVGGRACRVPGAGTARGGAGAKRALRPPALKRRGVFGAAIPRRSGGLGMWGDQRARARASARAAAGGIRGVWQGAVAKCVWAVCAWCVRGVCVCGAGVGGACMTAPSPARAPPHGASWGAGPAGEGGSDRAEGEGGGGRAGPGGPSNRGSGGPAAAVARRAKSKRVEHREARVRSTLAAEVPIQR
jgi:hypothetical protein